MLAKSRNYQDSIGKAIELILIIFDLSSKCSFKFSLKKKKKKLGETQSRN